MTCMSIDGLGKEIPLVWLPQTIGPTLDRDLIYLGMVHQLIAYQPPEVLPALNVARNKEDGNRNLELLCKRKSMHIVIAVAIVKGQYQQCALITSIFSILGRSIQFFKGLFQMQHTVVTPQIEEMATQVSPSCTVVREDNQALPRALPPPAYQFYQPTVVEACSHHYSQLLTHELLPSTLGLWMMDHQSIHYTSHQLLHARHHGALTGTRFVRSESVVVQRKGPIDGACGKDHRTGGSDIVGRVAGIGSLAVI